MTELDLVLKLVDAGASILLAVVCILTMRSERTSRELARAEDRVAMTDMATTLAVVADQTRQLVGDVTPVERPRTRTPPAGVSTEYSFPRGRGR